MLKERIQEIFDFTKSESPYRKANKGWINQDIFLDLSPSSDSFAQKNEAAKISFFWLPIQTLLANIALVIIISSLLVFTSLSFAKGKFDFNAFKTYTIKVEDNKTLQTTQLQDVDSINTKSEQNLETNELDKTNKIASFDDDNTNSEKEIITNQIDKQESLMTEKKNNMNIKILENKKSKSNFM